MKIKISKYIMGKVEDFACKRIEGSKNLYAYRGERNVTKMEEDIITGTLGEYAVYQLIRKQGLQCTKPDLKIYAKKRKSFAQDLMAENFKVHVKSQSLASEIKYGKSFLFQRSDKLVSDPDGNEFMAFTNVDLESREVEVLGFVNAKMMLELNLLGECKVPFYRKTKVAIYLEEFEKYGIVLDKLRETEHE